MTRVETLKTAYHLQQHPEGGWFVEMYTSPTIGKERPAMGSIYFLLDGAEISHFHQIDCEEIWYWHEGCGMRIVSLLDGRKTEFLLGGDPTQGQRAMAVIPAGSIFAAVNLEPAGYTFVSCATTPAFQYEGFRLIGREELQALDPEHWREIRYLAYEKV